MLIRMDTILRKARNERYGVAAPNVFNLESVAVAMKTAYDLHSPIIIDYGEMADDSSIYEMAEMVRFYAGKYVEIPVALNLDHGKSFASAVRAIRAGFTSVMVDRSEAPFEDNVRETAEICKMAHAVGVSVEAELGHVGQGVKYSEDRDRGLTQVEDALKFVQLTGVDCLAVAIGTAHGRYIGTPRLDFGRLVALREAVDVPLVLHGGSSTGDENLKKAVDLGISKINLFTDLSNAGINSLKEYLAREDYPNLVEAFAAGARGYGEMLAHYCRLFGSNDRL